MDRKIINYIVVCINEFAASKNLTEQQAYRYLYANKGIEFLAENYESFDCMIQQGCREVWYEESLIDSLMDFFSYEIVGMCGCGCPGDSCEVIRQILNIRNDANNLEYEQIQQRYKDDLHLDTKDLLQYGTLQFVLYMLDECGLLEHGSSINGCWLTDLGKMYLTVLNAWHEQEERSESE